MVKSAEGLENTDILKTGGHKVSPLEIEEALRQHPAVAECAVVGGPDAEWGERVAAVVVLSSGDALELSSFRAWAKELLVAHKVPSRLLMLEALRRNAVGKVMNLRWRRFFEVAAESPSRDPVGRALIHRVILLRMQGWRHGQ